MAEQQSIHKFKAGDIFGDRYTLEKLIGVGGFADVWKAIDNTTSSVVALKIYTNLDNDGLTDLAQEYTRMQSLNHTNILRAEHFDIYGNLPYLVMKFCPNGSLDKKIGKLDDEEILRIIRHIAEGLKYLHQCEIVHQDIKPANILIDDQAGNITYVLSDFGISSKTKTRLSHSVNQNQDSGMTEAYAPPEKFSPKREDRSPDRKGDIFSLGISLYELVVGALPFDDLSTGRQLQYGLAQVDFSEIKNEKIRNIIELCMQADKDARPTAIELIKILGEDNLSDEMTYRLSNSRKTVRIEDHQSHKAGRVFLIILSIILIALFGFIGYQRFGKNLLTSSKEKKEMSYVQVIDSFFINDYCLEMVKIPGGDFMMGCTDANDTDADAVERPAQKRHVPDFYMAKYEVTQKLWFLIMNTNPSKKINDNYPVHNVSWNDCQLFVQKLSAITGRNFTLPTEAEWEYAAKYKLPINSQTYYKYAGTQDSPSVFAWYGNNSENRIHAVGLKRPNDLGLYDMSGNVIEWCTDMYTNYATGDLELSQDQRVLRGGYYGSDAASIRCVSRGSCNYKTAMEMFGFRICMH